MGRNKASRNFVTLTANHNVARKAMGYANTVGMSVEEKYELLSELGIIRDGEYMEDFSPLGQGLDPMNEPSNMNGYFMNRHTGRSNGR